MRVLFAVHHPLDPRLGAPRASVSVASELEAAGHEVGFYGYDQAYGYLTETPTRLRMAFAWRLALFLATQHRAFDLVDVTTGDSYVWAAIRRLAPNGGPTIVSRSNGLEHLAHNALMERVGRGEASVSNLYPLYNGGIRLWEVRRSLASADGAILLNERERAYAVGVLGIDPSKLRVISHGLDSVWDDIPAPEPTSDDHARMCFVGTWGRAKGTADLVKALSLLRERRVRFSLVIAGCQADRGTVLGDIPSELWDQVTVVPSYAAQDLPHLLADREIFLFPSRFEGWGLAVAEAMAAGLTPVVTPVGAVTELISEGVSGFVVPFASPEALADRVTTLSRDPALRSRMRTGAWAASRAWRWSRTAAQTLAFYQQLRQPVEPGPALVAG